MELLSLKNAPEKIIPVFGRKENQVLLSLLPKDFSFVMVIISGNIPLFYGARNKGEPGGRKCSKH